MDEEKKSKEKNDDQPEFGKIAIGFVVAVLVLGGIVYAGYLYSQKKGKEKVLPAGYPGGGQPGVVDCSKPRDPAANIWEYYLKCDRIKVAEDAKWVKHIHPELGFSVALPEGLNTELYTNGLGVPYKEIPGTSHLLYSIDLASSRSGEFKEMTGKKYVENYWRQFGGIAGINYVEDIVNEQGVKGWRANYKFASGADSPNTDIFFELEKDSGDFVHFSSGVFDPAVFSKIVGSFKLPEEKPASEKEE